MARSTLDPTLDELLRDPFRDPANEADRRERIRHRVAHARGRRMLRLERRRAMRVEAGPYRFFWILFQPTSGETSSRFLVNRTTYRYWLGRKLLALQLRGAMGMEALRRALATAKEAARDRCRSSLDRGLALAALDVLLSLAAALAVEALNLTRALPPPRVLSAGGQTDLHAPLN